MKPQNLYRWTAVFFLLAGLLPGQILRAASLTVTPSAVSNTYPGYVTLQINGLATGAGVVVQKYLDVNTNGVVDAGDLLVEQGNPTDGKASPSFGGGTNFNVPGDLDGASNGAITANLLFNNGDFIQKTIGNYLFVISSTNGAFTPVTNSFNVTNLPYGQKITGTVTNSSGTAVPNAVVILFPPPRPGGDHGPGTPVAAGVANNAGVYSIPMPTGSYVPLAFKSNYVANYSAAPLVTLGSGQTLTTNVPVLAATTSVSGSYVDATNSSRVLAGVFIPLSTSGGLIAAGFTDTNGNFNIPVTASQTWNAGSDSSGLIVHGYVGYENDPTNVNSGATGVTILFPRETALFYGKVLDNLGSPIPGIAIEAYDNNNNVYQQDGWSDTNGNYAVGAVGGLGSNDPWTVGVDQNPTNYVFSQPTIQQNGGTNLSSGTSVQVNFTGIAVSGLITGNVKYNGTNVVGVGVNANATINSVQYQTSSAHTDSNGNYSLYVANGTWSVDLNCNGGDDSLNHILSGAFTCPNSQSVPINNNSGSANFTVQLCTGTQINTTSLPSGQVGSFYDVFLQGVTCNGNQNWSVNDPQDFPSALTLSSDGELFGNPDTSGTFNFSVNLNDGSGNSTNQSLSLTINPSVPPLQVTTTSLPNGTNGVFYSQNLQASGGTQPYSWSLAAGSASLPGNLSLATNGVISGTPVVSVTNLQFIVQVVDSNSGTNTQTLSLTITGAANPLQLTTSSLPGGTNGAFYSTTLQATGGQPPYKWTLAPGSANPPANLSLTTNGVLSGTPTVSVTNSQFIAQVTDGASNFVQKVLSVTIAASTNAPMVSLAIVNQPGSGQFKFAFNTTVGVNYSVQYSTDLKNWSTILTFTGSGGQETISSPMSAGSGETYYRLKIGP